MSNEQRRDCGPQPLGLGLAALVAAPYDFVAWGSGLEGLGGLVGHPEVARTKAGQLCHDWAPGGLLEALPSSVGLLGLLGGALLEELGQAGRLERAGRRQRLACSAGRLAVLARSVL